MITDLKDTVELMQSDNYIDRFKAEYYQTEIRYNRLKDLIVQINAGTAKFTPKCTKEVLMKQCADMGLYLYDLRYRANIEGIEL